MFNSDNDLAIISRAGILEKDMVDHLKSLKDSLEKGFERRLMFRPKYLMETSVLNNYKFPTPDSKYWQANLERDEHLKNLVMLAHDYNERCADIEILDARIAEIESKPDISDLDRARVKKLRVQRDRHQTILMYMQKEASERYREVVAWTEIMADLEPRMRFGTDDPERHLPSTFEISAIRRARLMERVSAIGAQDMNGAMNILALDEAVAEKAKATQAQIVEKAAQRLADTAASQDRDHGRGTGKQEVTPHGV